MAEVTEIYHVGQKYRMVFERGATKGVDGFKVEVNSDSREEAKDEILELYEFANRKAITVVPEEKK